MSLVWIIVLFIAFIADAVIRISMFVNDKKETFNSLSTVWSKVAVDAQRDLHIKFAQTTKINLGRFGINGEFPVGDVDLNSAYDWAGEITNVGRGIVKNKSFVSSEEILENMQKFIQNTGESFESTSDAIADKHVVEIFLKNDITKEFLWENKTLYNNVEIGDEVTLKFDNIGCTGVGSRRKGDNDGNKRIKA